MKNIIHYIRILLLSILLLTSYNSNAQTIALNKVDEFSGNHTIKTINYSTKYPKRSDFIDTDRSVMLSMMYVMSKDSNEYYYLNFLTRGSLDLGCLSEYTGKIYLLFNDTTKLEFKQISETNCTVGSFQATYVLLNETEYKSRSFGQMKENFDIIGNFELKKIRVVATNGYKDYDILPENYLNLKLHHDLIAELID